MSRSLRPRDQSGRVTRDPLAEPSPSSSEQVSSQPALSRVPSHPSSSLPSLTSLLPDTSSRATSVPSQQSASIPMQSHSDSSVSNMELVSPSLRSSSPHSRPSYHSQIPVPRPRTPSSPRLSAAASIQSQLGSFHSGNLPPIVGNLNLGPTAMPSSRLNKAPRFSNQYGESIEDFLQEYNDMCTMYRLTFIRKTYILLYHAFSCFFVLLVLFEGKKVTL